MLRNKFQQYLDADGAGGSGGVEEEKPNTFTQADVSNIVAKNVKEERTKILKALGIEDTDNLTNVGDILKEYKTIKDKEKSDLDRSTEQNAEKDKTIQALNDKLSAIEKDQKINQVLSEMQIDPKYTKTILKLMDKTVEDDKIKDAITNTIKEFLPDAIETPDLGVGKGEDKKPKPGAKKYLDDKYGKNKFYRT